LRFDPAAVEGRATPGKDPLASAVDGQSHFPIADRVINQDRGAPAPCVASEEQHIFAASKRLGSTLQESERNHDFFAVDGYLRPWGSAALAFELFESLVSGGEHYPWRPASCDVVAACLYHDAQRRRLAPAPGIA